MNEKQMSSYNAMVSKCKSTAAGPWRLSSEQWVQQVIDCLGLLGGAGILRSVPMAQAILESGWGSKPYLFGIKATKADFLAVNAEESPTHEIIDGQSVHQSDYFFKDKSIRGNFINYVKYIQRMKPDFLAASNTPDGFLSYLQKEPSYSTSPIYEKTILEIIQDNGLNVWDCAWTPSASD